MVNAIPIGVFGHTSDKPSDDVTLEIAPLVTKEERNEFARQAHMKGFTGPVYRCPSSRDVDVPCENAIYPPMCECSLCLSSIAYRWPESDMAFAAGGGGRVLQQFLDMGIKAGLITLRSGTTDTAPLSWDP